jgi:hypothetical protein
MRVWRFASKDGSHKSKERKKRATHTASVEEKKNSNKILVEKYEERDHLGDIGINY